MGASDELAKKAREWLKWKEGLKETEAGRLVYRIMSTGKTEDECLRLEQEIRDFVASDPPEEDLSLLGQYTEMLSMTCQAIREKRAGEGA